MQTTAAVIREPGGPFNVETLEMESPRAGEVLVKIAGVGLCHTDIVFSSGGRPYPMPAVLGHEGAGVIEAVGPGVEGFSRGDKVIIGFSHCGHCPRCDDGLPSYCREFLPLNFVGKRTDGSTALTTRDGPVSSHFFGQSSFAAHAVARVENLVKVPRTDLPLEILGTLGCGLQTGAGAVMRSMQCEAGSTLVVFGGGPVGLAALMGGVIQGCSTIILAEPVAARRKLALELGATHVIDPANEDVAARIKEILPMGVDYSIDTTGIGKVVETAFAALATHGMFGIVGVPQDPTTTLSINVASVMRTGQRIIGILEGDSDQQTFIPELIAHQAAGRFPFERLIRTFPLSEINAAVEAQARGECVKVVLVP